MTPHNRHRHLALYRVFSDPSWQHRTAIMRRIADAVGAVERKFQRVLGEEWENAYRVDWATVDQTYDLLVSEDRPDVLTRFRPMLAEVA
jgi:hypothetical protein